MGTSRRHQRDTAVVASLGRFCDDQGLGGAPGMAELAEAFVVVGLAGRASSTRGTYRSVLRRLGGLQKPVLATPFSGSAAAAPYSGAERAELFSLASAQRSAWRRSGALAMLSLGAGAGLRAGELVGAVGTDVIAGPAGLAVMVPGPPARTVPLSDGYAEVLAPLAYRAGRGHLFCPGGADRGYHNFVNNFARTLEGDPAGPKLSSGRCRSSFICDHLEAGTALAELVYRAGLDGVEALLRYAHHVKGAPQSKAALRAAAR